MEYIELLTSLMAIVFVSKIIAHLTKTVDILWYIILGLIGTQYVFNINPISLENWSTLGVVFIMFYAGWRESLPHFIHEIWRNKWIALIAGAGPFLGAWIAYSLLGFSETESIVAGFIFTATAVPYSIAILTNLGLERTRAAKAALATAMADNFISVFLAVGVLPAYALFQSGHEIHGFKEILVSVGEQIGLVAGAFLIFAILGLIILPDSHKKTELGIPNALQRDGILSNITHLIYRWRKAPGFYTISSMFFSVRIGVPMTLLLLFSLSWLAHTMGLHPAIGAYLTGLILHVSMYSKGKVDHMTEQQITVDHEHLSVFFYFAQEWIGPIFFIYLGSQLVADWSKAWLVVVMALIAGIIISFFQFITAYYSGKKTAKLPRHESILLGFAMLPRDVLAFVVLGIAVDSGLITKGDSFVIAIVLTVLMINIISSLGLLWYKPKYIQAEERYLDEGKDIVVK